MKNMLNYKMDHLLKKLMNRLKKALFQKDIHIDLHRQGFLQVRRRMKESACR